MALQTVLLGRYRHVLLPALRRRFGDTFEIRIAPHARRMVIISDPEDIRRTFAGPSTVFHAGEGNSILGPVMGQHSVLLLDEAEHLRVRQLLMPAFHGAPMRGYSQTMRQLTVAEVDGWQPGRVFRVHDRMQALTLEIILRVVFGVTDDGRLDELRPVVVRLVRLDPVLMLGWFYPRLRALWPWRQFAALQTGIDDLIYREIAARRVTDDLAGRSDVLSMLLRTSATEPDAGLTDPELRDNLITLLLAGHETTATALAWTLHELARDPELMRRGQLAADEGDSEYLDALVKEALRLHPVIYQVARTLTEPLEIGGYLVPSGCTVMPSIGLVQSDPRHHADPTRFDPTRFLGALPASNTWIPFGGGVRRCLGAGFAQLEATVVLQEVLRRYDLRPERERPERARSRNITLAPARGVRLSVTSR